MVKKEATRVYFMHSTLSWFDVEVDLDPLTYVAVVVVFAKDTTNDERNQLVDRCHDPFAKDEVFDIHVVCLLSWVFGSCPLRFVVQAYRHRCLRR